MEKQRQIPENVLIQIADRVKKRPQHWLIATILSVILPGTGMIYIGETKQGLRFFFITTVLYILEGITYEFVLTNDSIFLALLDAAFLISGIYMWLHGIVKTIQLYELNQKLWQIKVGESDKLDIFSKGEISELSDRAEEIRLEKQKEKEEKEREEEYNEKEKKDKKAALEMMLNDPKRAIVYMSIMVSMTFVATKVNSFLDKMWIAKISDEAVSALSTVSPIYSVVAAIGVGVGTGACVCISYTLGKKDFSRAQDLANASLFLSLLLSIPTALFLILSIDPIVSVQGPVITELATQYVIPLAIGCPAIILSGVLGCLFKAEGAMKIMTACALLSIPVNAVLTPVFINVCGWGILGASAATALGSVVSMVASFYFFKKGNYHFNIRFAIPQSAAIREILTIGGPKAIEEALGGILILGQTVIVATAVGSTALAITGLAFSFPYLMTMIPDSISAGSQPVCSAQAGAHNVSVMRSSMSYSFKIMLLLSLIPTFVLLLFTEPILTIFGNGNVVTSEDMIVITRLYAVFIPFYLLQRMCTDMLQVVRKANISAPIYLGFGVLRIILLFVFASTVYDVALIECLINLFSAVGLGAALIHYARKFDPNKVDENAEKRLDILSSIKPTKKATETR